eukprot:284817983_4
MNQSGLDRRGLLCYVQRPTLRWKLPQLVLRAGAELAPQKKLLRRAMFQTGSRRNEGSRERQLLQSQGREGLERISQYWSRMLLLLLESWDIFTLRPEVISSHSWPRVSWHRSPRSSLNFMRVLRFCIIRNPVVFFPRRVLLGTPGCCQCFVAPAPRTMRRLTSRGRLGTYSECPNGKNPAAVVVNNRLSGLLWRRRRRRHPIATARRGTLKYSSYMAQVGKTAGNFKLGRKRNFEKSVYKMRPIIPPTDCLFRLRTRYMRIILREFLRILIHRLLREA